MMFKIRKRKIECLPLLLTLLVVVSGCAGVSSPGSRRFKDLDNPPVKKEISEEEIKSVIDESIPELMEKGVIPGLSIAVVSDGRILLSRGYGVRNAETGEPVTDETVFEACSLGKPVFSYAVLKLAQAGVLDLDIPLADYTGDLYIEENFLGEKINDERIRKITARMVLSHMTGFPNWRNERSLEVDFNPGESFSYSGEGYVFLQKVVEKITGRSLNQMMEELVFKPLAMESSGYTWKPEYENRIAVPHSITGVPGRPRKMTKENAASSLYTTAADYARFINAILSETGLDREYVDEMLTGQQYLSMEYPESFSWGLGFGLQSAGGEDSFWHWGDNGDYKCFIIAYKKWRTGIVYFTNSHNGLSIAKEIVERSLGGEHPVFESSLMSEYADYNSHSMRFVRTYVSGGVDEAIEKFDEMREEYGEDRIIDEYLLNSIGYELLAKGKIREAVRIFEINVELYPGSFNVYDSLGEAYMEAGEKEQAITNYLRSVEINPENLSGIRALRKLRFIPGDFEVPAILETERFRLRMLSEDDLDIDYDALASSWNSLREHYAAANRPGQGISLEENRIAIRRYQRQFEQKLSFAYTVMNIDESRCLGRVHINPSFRDDYDAEVSFWIRDSELDSGLDEALYSALKRWLEESWPFERIAWPGREISWQQWRDR